MSLFLFALSFAFATGELSTINKNYLSGFGPYMIDASQSSEALAAILPVAELRLRTGGDEILTDDEFRVDKYMRQLRNQLIAYQNADGKLYKQLDYGRIFGLRDTDLYQLLYDMPKGGNIHLHLKLAVNYTVLIEHLLENYRDKLFVVTEHYPDRNRFYLTFKPPETCTDTCKEISPLSKYARVSFNCDIATADCSNKFMHFLVDNSVFGPIRQSDLNQNGSAYAWTLFEDLYTTVSDTIDLANVTEWYMRNLVTTSSQENIDYLELRTSPEKVYVFNNANQPETLTLQDELKIYKKGIDGANEILRKNNLPTVDATLIPTGRKVTDGEKKAKSMASTENAWKLAQNDNKTSIRTLGYDLVGQEDPGYSWDYQKDVFEFAKKNKQKCPIHAGETNWGTGLYRMADSTHVPGDINAFSPDNNLLTAIQHADDQLVPRVGHGLALAQHPLWIEAMRAKGQCVVAMTLSNQILQYVQDLRRHPLSGMINSGLKVALGADDPAIYQITFTDEFIAAYVSANLDIAALKAMIKNSYLCSLLSDAEKEQKITEWEKKWQKFIEKYARRVVSGVGQDDRIWNDKIDGALFDLYKSVHSADSNSNIKATTDITCNGGKFVLPQGKCVTYYSMESEKINKLSLSTNSATRGHLSGLMLLVISAFLYFF